jgi:hypothetical protein
MFLTDSSSWNVCLVGLFYSILSEFLLVFHDENNVKFTRDAWFFYLITAGEPEGYIFIENPPQ